MRSQREARRVAREVPWGAYVTMPPNAVPSVGSCSHGPRCSPADHPHVVAAGPGRGVRGPPQHQRWQVEHLEHGVGRQDAGRGPRVALRREHLLPAPPHAGVLRAEPGGGRHGGSGVVGLPQPVPGSQRRRPPGIRAGPAGDVPPGPAPDGSPRPRRRGRGELRVLPVHIRAPPTHPAPDDGGPALLPARAASIYRATLDEALAGPRARRSPSRRSPAGTTASMPG